VSIGKGRALAELIVLFGIPGSGKSTWATAQGGYEVVSFTDGLEDNAYRSLEAKARLGLLGGKSVIADGCSLLAAQRRRWLDIGHEAYVDRILRVFDVDTTVAIERQDGRENPVPEDVVRRYADSFDQELEAAKSEDWDRIDYHEP